jgi:hypothetical protein
MGCFNSTCGLTGLPIQYNEQIVIVTCKDIEPVKYPVYDFKNRNEDGSFPVIEGEFEEVDKSPTLDDIISGRDLEKIESIIFGTYNTYGWIHENEISEDQDAYDVQERSLYFHRWAWDWCLSFNKVKNRIEKDKKKIVDLYDYHKRQVDEYEDRNLDDSVLQLRLKNNSLWFKDRIVMDLSLEEFEKLYNNQEFFNLLFDFKAVILVCNLMRIDPFSRDYFLGSQVGHESLLLYRRLIPKMQEHIDKKEKEWNESLEKDDRNLFDHKGTEEGIFWNL